MLVVRNKSTESLTYVPKKVQSSESDFSIKQFKLNCVFYRQASGDEPVRAWLKALKPDADRKIVGADILAVQYGWPLGLPLVDNLGGGIWEVRSKLRNRIARVLFVIEDGAMILLHGFIKKVQKTPVQELEIAKDRLSKLRGCK
ncbi:type II toxin-antitoxin system RelE/ParE family toxin [Limnobacter sp. 130]|uniref:type II toxin-antitoxin system RelE/ParE family toxin n=1 Tax=Limnobacter sp. 130 TaxID=2653147 RepID=UPI0019155C38|nr:type II toxin-antitoxin system RelE/ParE family toxin [Limnobacter sp. 130]